MQKGLFIANLAQTKVGDTLNVRIYEHIKDEEQYAENLFTGTKYAEYNVDKNTGDVEKME